MRSRTSIEKHLGFTPEIDAKIYRYVSFMGLLIITLAIVVIFGWYADIQILKRVLPDKLSMKMNAALAFLFLGFSIICLGYCREKKPLLKVSWAGRIFAACAGLIGLLSGAEYLFRIDLGIDQIFILDDVTASGIFPGRMSPISAFCFALLGLTFGIQGSSKKNESVAQVLCFLILLVAYGTTFGYLLDSPQLYGVDRMNTMPLLAAIGFLIVGVAGICLYHNHHYIAIVLSPSPAGYTTRRLLPIIFLGPFVFGWVRWTFISDEWLKGRLTTAFLSAFAAGITSYVASYLAWKMHEEYSEKIESEVKVAEQIELIAWREKLVATLVHDLRTPLTSARLAAQLFNLKRDQPKERMQELGKKMTMAIDRSDRLLRDLLDATSALAGVVPNITLSKCHMKEVLLRTLTLLPQNGNKVQVDCPDEIVGMWNEDALIRIVENLVSNALKYGDSNELITVRVTQEVPESIRLKVHNFGPPIPKEEQEGLFDLFSRRFDNRYNPGWGIGLVTVKALTDALGGKLYLRSTLKQGTEFMLELPIGMTSETFPHRRVNDSGSGPDSVQQY